MNVEVTDYPAAAALRRRRDRQRAVGEAFPLLSDVPQPDQEQPNNDTGAIPGVDVDSVVQADLQQLGATLRQRQRDEAFQERLQERLRRQGQDPTFVERNAPEEELRRRQLDGRYLNDPAFREFYDRATPEERRQIYGNHSTEEAVERVRELRREAEAAAEDADTSASPALVDVAGGGFRGLLNDNTNTNTNQNQHRNVINSTANTPRRNRPSLVVLRTSQVYCLLSFIVALLAIVTTTAPPFSSLWDPHGVALVSSTSGSEGATAVDSRMHHIKKGMMMKRSKGEPVKRSSYNNHRPSADGSITHQKLDGNVNTKSTRVDSEAMIEKAGMGNSNARASETTVPYNYSPPTTYGELFRTLREFVTKDAWEWDSVYLQSLLGYENTVDDDVDDDGGEGNGIGQWLQNLQKDLPPGLKWVVPVPPPSKKKEDVRRNHQQNKSRRNKHTKEADRKAHRNQPVKPHRDALTPSRLLRVFSHGFLNLIDPSVRHPSSDAFTKVVDKVLSSTPRILAIANLLLAVTYLLHSFVAEWFLGRGGGGSGVAIATNAAAAADTAANTGMGGTNVQTAAPAGAVAAASPNTRLTRSTRERLGGYLLFKLLLISAVVEPDTLDLLILLSWYTLLSFLRSLAHLAGSATSHAAQSGLPPVPGVRRLLVAVLVSDVCAAGLCAALFHGAGWSTVLLLSCDCALLAVDVTAHLARHVGQLLEESHGKEVGALEERQLRLGEDARSASPEDDISSGTREGDAELVSDYIDKDNKDDSSRSTQAELRDRALDESRRIDRDIEALESQHSSRLSLLESTIFGLEQSAYAFTICHFLHIWSLHGVSFGLVDAVLSLHLHSAVAAMGRKIVERQQLTQIARDLDSQFADATETELLKCAQSGDVCAVCLGSMTGLRRVKKVGCGHFYHKQCLQEVVERARSIEASKCPLCRASIVDGTQENERTSTNNTTNQAAGDAQEAQTPDQEQAPEQQQPEQQHEGQAAPLFSFSTEAILPTWLPIPNLSFEVVRRPAAPAAEARGATLIADRPQQQQRRQEQAEMPFWRRLLVLSGAIPMNAEEEAAAIDQLVDMFPQYDRADLLRELRQRGSSEGVVESILAGMFTGVARGEALQENQQLEIQTVGLVGTFTQEDDNSILADGQEEHEVPVDGRAEEEEAQTVGG